MVKKRYCDGCEKDITNDVIFEAGIYDTLLEEETLERDLCKKCMKELRKHFPNFPKK